MAAISGKFDINGRPNRSADLLRCSSMRVNIGSHGIVSSPVKKTVGFLEFAAVVMINLGMNCLGGTPPSASCGRYSLYWVSQSSAMAWTCSMELNR